MSEFRDQIIAIQEDIDAGELTFEQIAVKYGVSLRDVDRLALDIAEQDTFYHDELERDWDEPYVPEGNEDAYLDQSYEERYELEDF